MDSQHFTEPPARKTWRIKLLIGIFSVALLGQLSALFIPAISGETPAPISIYGCILWVGLLFMSIWKLKEKGVVKGFLCGALIGFLIYCLAIIGAGYFEAEIREIDKAVESSNRNLPKMIDEITRIDTISIDHKSKNYFVTMTLLNYTLSDSDIDLLDQNFTESIKPLSCSNNFFLVLFSKNYSINYVYRYETGEVLRKYILKPGECISTDRV